MRILISLTVLVLLCAGGAYAQFSGRVAAEIPFDFYLGNDHFAAGKYLVHSITNSAVFLLESTPVPGKAVAWTGVLNVPKPSAASDTKLVFLKYDNEHSFLREVYVGTGYIWTAPMSKAEREHVSTKLQFPTAQVQRVTVLASLR